MPGPDGPALAEGLTRVSGLRLAGGDAIIRLECRRREGDGFSTCLARPVDSGPPCQIRARRADYGPLADSGPAWLIPASLADSGAPG
jgi:hypothetical protein